MRTPRRSATLAALLAAPLVALVLAGGGGGAAAAPGGGAAAGRVVPMIVVLRGLSVAEQLDRRGAPSSESEQRAWSADAFHAQEDVLARLAAAGLPLVPTHRFTRLANGFAAPLGPAQVAALGSDPAVAGVYPDRAVTALPLASAPRLRRPRSLDGSGITVAAIGVDTAAASALAARILRDAPGAVVTPLALGAAPTASTLIAALERGADPNGDGDCHDAARIVVAGAVDPLAATFPKGPLPWAAADVVACDSLVVAGSSLAASAATAAAAALVGAARPRLGAEDLGALVEQARTPAGAVDLARALAAEVVVRRWWWRASASLVSVRSISSRTLPVALSATPAGTVVPNRMTLRPGGGAAELVTVRAPVADLAVTLVASIPGGPPVRLAVPGVPRRSPAPLVTARLSGPASPSDASPARLALDLAAPAGALTVELATASGRPLGVLARLREVAAGRTVLALTGRAPGGARLAPGSYGLRVVAEGADGQSRATVGLRFEIGRTTTSSR